jgi:hypothetical protein
MFVGGDCEVKKREREGSHERGKVTGVYVDFL